MLVLAVDPGRVTGWASYNTETGAHTSWEATDLTLDNCLVYSVIVCEDYRITDKTAQLTQQTDALEIIGTLKNFCAQHGIKFVLQQPSAKKFARPNKLQALGWSVATKDNHADDASAHLLRLLVKEKLLRADEMKTMQGVLK